MDIHITNKTNKSWEVAYIIKVRQLFSKHKVSKIVFVGLVEGGTDKKNVVSCAVK